MRPLIGNRIYGCDDCLAVCPWNKYAKKAQEVKLQAREELVAPRLEELAKLDDPAFRALFSGSPVKRLGRNRFVRNVLIAIGNSGDVAFLDSVIPLLRDDSPIVRLAAVWALGQLAPAEIYGRYRNNLIGEEQDAAVQDEWNLSKGNGNEQA